MFLFTLMALMPGAIPVSALPIDDGSDQPCAPEQQASVPACCLTPECPVLHSLVATDIPVPTRITISKVVFTNKFASSQVNQTDANLDNNWLHNLIFDIPSPPTAKPLCRSSMGSEEPPLS